MAQDTTLLTRIKRIRSHVGFGQYLDDCHETTYVIKRRAEIPSPYAYCPYHIVYAYKGIQHIVIIETSHKCYDVFSVPSALLLDKSVDN